MLTGEKYEKTRLNCSNCRFNHIDMHVSLQACCVCWTHAGCNICSIRKGNDMSRISSSSNHIGCLTVVGIIFVVLKLLAIQPVASWSWIWVLCPFWILIAIDVIAILVVIPVLLVIYKILSRK